MLDAGGDVKEVERLVVAAHSPLVEYPLDRSPQVHRTGEHLVPLRLLPGVFAIDEELPAALCLISHRSIRRRNPLARSRR